MRHRLGSIGGRSGPATGPVGQASRSVARAGRAVARIAGPVGRVAAVLTLVSGFLVLAASRAPAQESDPDTVMPDPQVPQGENLEVPEGWRYRLDTPDEDTRLVAAEDPAASNIRFVNMTPGWHVTTGPRLILYHPASRASGSYRATVTMHLFAPGERNEAYGLFVGGRNLDAADQRYLYFLIRRSGEYLVKLREGDGTRVIVDWTAHDAIVPYDDQAEGSVANTLTVEARGDSLHFSVNGTEVASRPKGDLPVDGLVGWRVNHALNLHVSEFSVEDLE